MYYMGKCTKRNSTIWAFLLIVAMLVSLTQAVFAVTDTVSAESPYPSYAEAYERMIAYKTKERFTEGAPWTNFTPYGTGPLGEYYRFRGGNVKGASLGVGCAAFAFILSDAAFGDLPVRTVNNGDFTFEDVKVGDILRVDHNSHFVIVLEKGVGGVIVAEGNYNKSVHWGRAMSKAEVMAADFVATRYPANYVEDDPDADVVVGSGTEGNLEWSLKKAGTLTISGNGAMPDYSENDQPAWSAHNDAINTIIIEDGVTSIGAYAFYCSKALSVYIPDSVTGIGDYAFHKSGYIDLGTAGPGLVSVTIPGSVKTIGAHAFDWCLNLTSVTVDEGLETIGEQAFRACNSLQYMDFPSTIKLVGEAAFTSCEKMTRVRFMPSDNAVKMGDNTFTQCWNLSDVTLPKKMDRISAGMFFSCKLLGSLYIPAGITDVAQDAFTSSGLQYGEGISYGGNSTEWANAGGNFASFANIPPLAIKVTCDVPYDDPFAEDSNDPGDISFPCADGHIGEVDEDGNCNVCGDPMSGTSEPAPSVAPSPSDTPLPSVTAEPSDTPSSSGTSEPSDTASPSDTPVPSGTPSTTPDETADPIELPKQTQKMTVTPGSLTLYVGGDAKQLKVSNAKGSITYKSSNTKIVRINSKGKVTPLSKGKTTITVTASGDSTYKTASKKINVTVYGKPTKVKSVKAIPGKSKSTLNVSWKKVSSVSGYIIRYSYNKNMENSKTIDVNKGNSTSKTIKKLTSKKYVYVQVQAYKKDGNTKIKGTWSTIIKSKGKIK